MGTVGEYYHLKDARMKYLNKRLESIKKRNIEFNITFEEWYIWFFIRGVDKNLPSLGIKNKDTLCMCRKGDVGPYSLDNIYIATLSQNSKDHHTFNPQDYSKQKVKCHLPIGVFNSIKEASKHSGIHEETLKHRIKSPNFPEYYRLK